MKYQVTLFTSGYPVVRVEANTSTPKQAANFAIGKHVGAFEHARVVGKKVFRFNKKLQPIKNEMRVHKTQVGPTPALLLMIGKYPEFLRFKDERMRDDTYERVSKCITSPSAASVESDPAQTDITASSEGTSVSSSSMFLKISSGFAESVTLLDLLTLLTIEKSFGKDSVEDTDTSTWLTGSKNFLSRPKPETLWATVLKLPDPDVASFPGTNDKMVSLEGTTIAVTKTGTDMFIGESFLWRPEWLDFEHVIVKIAPPRGEVTIREMRRHIGQVVKMEVCKSSVDYDLHYNGLGYCWYKHWLKIGVKAENTERVTAKVKDIPVNSKSKGIVFVQMMQQYIGKTMTFKPHEKKTGVYIAEGWQWSKNWLEFEDNIEELKKDIERMEVKDHKKFKVVLSDEYVEELRKFKTLFASDVDKEIRKYKMFTSSPFNYKYKGELPFGGS